MAVETKRDKRPQEEASLAAAAESIESDPAAAAAHIRTMLRVRPGDADLHRLLGKALRRLGEDVEAEKAELDAIAASACDPVLIGAAQALLANDLQAAETALRPRLKEKPEDVAAIRMMAELAGRLGRNEDAEKLLRRALELAPGFIAARANLATAVYRQNRPAEAVEILDPLIAEDPGNLSALNLKAAALGRLGCYDEAIGIYERLIKAVPDQPKIWMSYAHSLKTVGRFEDSIAAYRRGLALAPTMGELWWSLANLKTLRFSDADIAAMESALGAPGIPVEDRLHLHFALGRAREERGAFAAAFEHYAEGNRMRHRQIGYDSAEISNIVARSKTVFTSTFFAERAGYGDPAPDSIFIVGMPRSGSTLIEQMLASHSEIEGTMELPDLPALARRLGARRAMPGDELYPLGFAKLDAAECRDLGEEYLDRTRVQRKSGKRFFIDKLPNNWINTGLIHLILPNARIIDARRHPLDCCLSNFKQHYARGQGFAYSLADLGRYYVDYVDLMAHFDTVLPGRVFRVEHEMLIDAPEAELRRMLDHIGVAFEAACLDFHENQRAVRTASSEQVRRPINREGVGQWRNYEPWLEPLKQALGPAGLLPGSGN